MPPREHQKRLASVGGDDVVAGEIVRRRCKSSLGAGISFEALTDAVAIPAIFNIATHRYADAQVLDFAVH
jgi:hypothetical protein